MINPPIPLSSMGDRLASLKVPELKGLAKQMSLSISGRKQELIDRIVQKCSQFHTLQSAGSLSDTQSHFYTQHMVNGYREMEQLLLGTTSMQQPSSTPGNIRMMKAPVANAHPSSVSAPGGSWGPLHATNGGGMAVNGAAILHHANAFAMRGGPPPAIEITVGYAPELNNARCLCPVKASRGSGVSTCAKCATAVHSKCHQTTQMTDSWHCEACRAVVFEPFFRVQTTFGFPTFLRFTASNRQQIQYDIPPDDLVAMKQRKGTQPGCLELQLRCFAMKDPLSEGHCWPTCCTILVNGYACALVQRAVPGQTNTSKVLREQPLNLLPMSRHGTNTIDIRTADSLPNLYVFVIQRVEKQDLDHLLQHVVAQSELITYAQAKADVIKSFGGDDDDDIVATCTMLSVRCPLGLCVIDLPARGIHCQHLQCFDLKTFLLFNRTARSRAWKCIVCHKFIALDDLRIDPYLKQLLADVRDDEELEEVEIFPDATWRKRVTEDDPSDKKPKPATDDKLLLDIIPIDVLGSPRPAAAASVPLDSIDLTLSSDDEDEVRPLADLLHPAPPSSSSSMPHVLWNAASTWTTTPAQPQWSNASAFGGMLDVTYDDPWASPPPPALAAAAAPGGFAGFSAPTTSSAPRLPSLAAQAPTNPSSSLHPSSSFSSTPGFAQYYTNGGGGFDKDSTPPPLGDAWHQGAAKARKRLHRGDQVLPPASFPQPPNPQTHTARSHGFTSSSSSSSNGGGPPKSAMSMANVIYLDDDSE
ncbi:hypothetical protein H257_02804 [Aphanomyces astaci]|uniref:SP-RING-type domain-containing protein n=3 Tax=Aphanomyces astaci TaxID=112090 RepID=W4H157_APHAT|nr:hypothetical protein H257_02804 [Aphanomyces astaci]ETV84888.1 hypothetical protein H257_02804 [Aphanomyces astaci]|eukprot:XP_009824906.1 hypothetical protein H257_02804 [Aphanomyces astaci]